MSIVQALVQQSIWSCIVLLQGFINLNLILGCKKITLHFYLMLKSILFVGRYPCLKHAGIETNVIK
jgi:hypothetical protein